MDEQEERELELHIQRKLVEFLRARGWYVERMLANAYQTGIPDLYCYHPRWRERWVEVKRPDNYSFTRHKSENGLSGNRQASRFGFLRRPHKSSTIFSLGRQIAQILETFL